MQNIILAGLTAAAAVNAQLAQGYPPAPVLLTATKSGVLPTLPTGTPFTGVETLEGAIIVKGPLNKGYTGLLGDAVPQMNVPGTTYKATLPSTNFDPYFGSTVTGSLSAVVPANGTGVIITVNLMGLPSPSMYGAFAYHIHGAAVPADGNCTSTLGHLDPTNRGEYYPCDVTAPQTCQAGDLSGKHGKPNATSFTASYYEPYLSTTAGSTYFIGGMGVVVHSSNTTRITCANLLAVAANSTATNGTAPAPSSTVTPPAATYTGAASQIAVGGSIVGGLLLAAAALL